MKKQSGCNQKFQQVTSRSCRLTSSRVIIMTLTLLSCFVVIEASVLERSRKSPVVKKQQDNVEKLQRGKVLCNTKNITPEDLYKAYKEIQLDYKKKAFAAHLQNKWKILNQKDGVEVSILHHPNDPSCPYVRMEAIFPSSVEECWEFLKLSNWDKTMPKMDPFYESLLIHDEFDHKGVNIVLAQKLTKRILAFGKRDFAFLSVSDQPLEDGTWVSGTVSVITPRIPRKPTYTRAFQDSIAFYKRLPPISAGTGERTLLTIICRIDLNDSTPGGNGGFVPMWLYVKTIGLTGVKSVLSMRQALEKEMAIQMPKRKLQQAQKLLPSSILKIEKGEQISNAEKQIENNVLPKPNEPSKILFKILALKRKSNHEITNSSTCTIHKQENASSIIVLLQKIFNFVRSRCNLISIQNRNKDNR